MIIVSGTLTIDPADVETAMALGATMAEASLAEEGCSAYGFWQDPADPSRARVFEEWASQEALDLHFATPHMADFMAGHRPAQDQRHGPQQVRGVGEGAALLTGRSRARIRR